MKPLKTVLPFLAMCVFATHAWAEEPDTETGATDSYELQQKLKRMERRIQKLEKQQGTTTSRPSFFGKPQQDDDKEVPDIYRKLPRPTGSSADSSFSTATGLSRFFNPAISVNGLFLGQYRSIGNADTTNERSTGMKIQEMELQFTANVDTFLRANFRVTFEGDEIDVEESFVDVLLMNRLALRAGKFYSAFGKHNLLHTHQFPFIDRPLINDALFGEEGLLEIGAGVSYLVPVPWYSEAMFQFIEGANEEQFDGPLNDDFVYLFHLKNLWDLDEDTTLELGGTAATGRNQTGATQGSGNGRTYMAGGNMTVKWNPARRARYNTLIWQTEYLGSFKQTGIDTATGMANPDDRLGGLYSMLQYQFMERWWVQGRYDYLGLHQASQLNDQQRWTGLLAYVPSEFTAIRLQYSYLDEQISKEHQVLLQLNFSMGSHPAHMY